MAIGIHIVSLKKHILSDSVAQLVEHNGDVPNSGDGTMELDAFLLAEAASGYLPTLLTDYKCITAKVSDINSA